MSLRDNQIIDLITIKRLIPGVNKSFPCHFDLAYCEFSLLNHNSRFSSINNLFFQHSRMYNVFTTFIKPFVNSMDPLHQ